MATYFLNKKCVPYFIGILLILWVGIADARAQDQKRDNLITDEMNCVASVLENNTAISWDDVCYSHSYLEKSQAQSIVSDIKSKGLLDTKRKGSLNKFTVPPQRLGSTKRRKK